MAKVVELPKLEVNEEIKVGGNGHKLSLRQKIARWLLKDAYIDELHIGAHSINIDGDVIKMNPLATDPGTPAEGWLWHLAGTDHKPRYHNGTTVKDVGEGAAPGTHDLAGTQHNPDTLANLNSKINDATLDKNTDKRDPNTHNLAGAEHGADTLANLNAKVNDANLANEAEVIKKDGSVAFAGDQAMGGNKLTGLGTPVAGGDAATKDHVDSVVQGLDWQPSVLDELDTPPGTPTTGDRYLVIATATGDWVGHEDDIAEWNGASWDFTTPNKGFAVWIEDVGRQKVYNGTNWVAFGTTIDHGNLLGQADDDHAQYLNNTRHDIIDRHSLGSVVPHDGLASLTEKAHGSLTGVDATDHHDNVNDPTAGEKASLPGTSGTPGAANKFVTDVDPRNTNARTPSAHNHAGDTLTPADLTVGDLNFKNGWSITEHPRYGLLLRSPKEKLYRMVLKEC
ncbi:hypothetical protein ES703_43020 [subsurface metagenome]